MASVVIQEPPTDPSQMAMFAKKVQTIIRRCMVSIGGTLGYTPSQYNIQDRGAPDRGACGVKRGARRQPGRGASCGRTPVPPFPNRHEHVDPGHAEVERGEGSGAGQLIIDPFDSPNLDIPSFSLGLTPASQSLRSGSGTSQMPSPPGLGFASFQSPHSTSFGFSGFRLLRAQPVHLHRIRLYRRHLHLMKRSGRMTWTVYSITDSGIVLVRRQRGSRHPTGRSYN
ncbi:hypothetical protein M9H77_04032 [Catharanthus roseus]|uniref:Uncharacterized protein n=1 Tax=Catharanthus roseus TaxID=4058 RepID=A0ACC0CCX8_CATRO|nr:hypothetical protein M9H77_04032 [Catharanthus roseus]